MLKLLKSQKFQALLASLIAMILTAIFGREVISEKLIMEILALIAGLAGVYMGAHAHVDGKTSAAKILSEGAKKDPSPDSRDSE